MVDFLAGEGFGQAFPAARQGEVLGDIGRQELLVLGKAVERPQGGDLQVKAFAAEAAGGSLGWWARARSRSCWRKAIRWRSSTDCPVCKALFLRPGDELVQQRGVGPLRVLGLAALVAEVLEEVLDQLIHASFWPVNRS